MTLDYFNRLCGCILYWIFLSLLGASCIALFIVGSLYVYRLVSTYFNYIY